MHPNYHRHMLQPTMDAIPKLALILQFNQMIENKKITNSSLFYENLIIIILISKIIPEFQNHGSSQKQKIGYQLFYDQNTTFIIRNFSGNH